MPIIVSRHPAAVEFIRQADPRFAGAPVIESATADDVRGQVVAGNLPLNLAALCAEVLAVEFSGQPPRGLEYSLDDMRAAGAVLRSYQVAAMPPQPCKCTVCGAAALYDIWDGYTYIAACSRHVEQTADALIQGAAFVAGHSHLSAQ